MSKMGPILLMVLVASGSVFVEAAGFTIPLGDNGKSSRTIELEDGVYRLDAPMELGAENSGTPEKPLVVRAKNRGKVVISGAVRISDWRKTDLCGGNVWVGTIPGTGEIPGWSSAGCLHKIDLAKLETPISVFARGERLTCARWPREGEWTHVNEVMPPDGKPGRILRVGEDADVAAWAAEKDLWTHGLWKFEWADAKCRVLGVDVANKTIRVDDTMVKFGFEAGCDFYVFNAVSAIGGPGEWALDRKSRRLYVWPKGDIRDVEITSLDHIVTANGLSNARFEGIVFEGTRCATFLMDGVTNVVVDACCFRHTSKEGIRATNAQRLRVSGSDFYDLGEGGIWIEGGDTATLERGDNVVDNCHIHHYGKVVANYKPGVCMKGSGNAITHNLIHHTDHQAIMFNCTDLYIGWNVIHDTLQHNDDAGAIYCCGQDGRGWTDMRGTLVEHNFIHNTGKLPHSRTCMAIYFDDSSSGIRARYNFVNRANIGIYGGGGNLHLIESNLLVSCARPLMQGRRDNALGKKSPLWLQLVERRKNPVWAGRFPETGRILALEDGRFAHCPLFNRFVGNVEIGCGDDQPDVDVEKRGNVWADNLKLKDETGCRDFFGRDWTLESGSRAFSALGGDLGFARAGLYDGDGRFSRAVKFGEPVGVVQRPHPDYTFNVGMVGVQIRPVSTKKAAVKECFADELINCEPIPGFENILRLRAPGKARREWTEYSFSFVPKYDLAANVHLLGKWNADFTAYDDFRIEGATVEDDLETGEGWHDFIEKNDPPRNNVPGPGGLVDESTRSFKAAKGRRFVLAHGEHHYVHRIEMKKGVRVTVTLKARSAETGQD